MSVNNSPDKGVCHKHKSKNKGVCDHCVLCRCWYTPPVCILKNIPPVAKIKAYINLPDIVFPTRINQTFQRVKRRKEN